MWSRPSVRDQKGNLLWISSSVVWNALFSAAAALWRGYPHYSPVRTLKNSLMHPTVAPTQRCH